MERGAVVCVRARACRGVGLESEIRHVGPSQCFIEFSILVGSFVNANVDIQAEAGL